MSQAPQNENRTHGFSEQARDTAQHVVESAADYSQSATRHFVQEPARDLVRLARDYAKDHPDVAACWAFAFGIVVGWKLKP